jgi:hypothetical protein
MEDAHIAGGPIGGDDRAFRYLAVLAITAFLCLGSVSSLFYGLHRLGRLVAPPISANVSFDEKLRFIRDGHLRQCDVLAAGSSMTLNNLESQPLIERLPRGTSFLNIGSFGMKIGHTRALVEHLLQSFQPHTVIVVCGTMDFYQDPRRSDCFDFQEIDDFLHGAPYWKFVLKHFDLRYYLNHASTIGHLRADRTSYASVYYDAWGGIPLDIAYPRIDAARWNDKVQPEFFNPIQYQELAALADFLGRHQTRLVVAQPPLRAGSISSQDMPAVEAHWQRVASLASTHGFRFVNYHKVMKLDDRYFADYSHLNKQGAAVFTEAFMRECVSSFNGLRSSALQEPGRTAFPQTAGLQSAR